MNGSNPIFNVRNLTTEIFKIDTNGSTTINKLNIINTVTVTNLNADTVDGVHSTTICQTTGNCVYASTNFTVLGNLSVGRVLSFGTFNMTTCNATTNGQLVRNLTNLYYCNATCWKGWGSTGCG